MTSLPLCPQHSVTAILFNVPLWIYVCRVRTSEDTEHDAEGVTDAPNDNEGDDNIAEDGEDAGGNGDDGSAAKEDDNKSKQQPSGPELLSWVLQQIEHIVACHREFIRATVPDATWTLLSAVSLVDSSEGAEVLAVVHSLNGFLRRILDQYHIRTGTASRPLCTMDAPGAGSGRDSHRLQADTDSEQFDGAWIEHKHQCFGHLA